MQRYDRISEVLSLTKKQFVFDEDPDFIIVKNMVVVVRKKKAKRKRRNIRDEALLPKARATLSAIHSICYGVSQPFEPSSGECARAIVRFITGKYCHYFRSQGELVWKNLLKHIRVKRFFGVVDASTLSDYVKTDWKDFRDRILGISVFEYCSTHACACATWKLQITNKDRRSIG